MQYSMHEAICNYKTAGAHYCTCLHLVAMECCGHAEIVYDFQWIDHGAVGRLSLKQQFRISDVITFIVLNFWSLTPIRTRSYVRLADEIQVIFEIFKIHYRSK